MQLRRGADSFGRPRRHISTGSPSGAGRSTRETVPGVRPMLEQQVPVVLRHSVEANHLGLIAAVEVCEADVSCAAHGSIIGARWILSNNGGLIRLRPAFRYRAETGRKERVLPSAALPREQSCYANGAGVAYRDARQPRVSARRGPRAVRS
jgi:hypothetical protein